MNKKTFLLALIFFCVSLVWFVVNVIWAVQRLNSVADLVISLFFMLAGAGMMYNELNKKKRLHIADVKKNKIP